MLETGVEEAGVLVCWKVVLWAGGVVVGGGWRACVAFCGHRRRPSTLRHRVEAVLERLVQGGGGALAAISVEGRKKLT